MQLIPDNCYFSDTEDFGMSKKKKLSMQLRDMEVVRIVLMVPKEHDSTGKRWVDSKIEVRYRETKRRFVC